MAAIAQWCQTWLLHISICTCAYIHVCTRTYINICTRTYINICTRTSINIYTRIYIDICTRTYGFKLTGLLLLCVYMYVCLHFYMHLFASATHAHAILFEIISKDVTNVRNIHAYIRKMCGCVNVRQVRPKSILHEKLLIRKIHIYTYTHVNIYIHTCVYTYVHTFTCMHVDTHIDKYFDQPAKHGHVRLTCMYIHTHINKYFQLMISL
jgi:hypothetical protein